MAAQKGNTVNASVPVVSAPLVTDPSPPTVTVEGGPVRQLNGAALMTIGAKYAQLFQRYASERQPAEQRWLKNLRQYMGIYDPDVLQKLPPNGSQAYPRLTRMKCIAMLSRIMNLMFPGNEDNWELTASPSPSMSPEAVKQAVDALMAELGANGEQVQITDALIQEAVRKLAEAQAATLTTLIKDQLAELGGDQTVDWVSLNRKIADSGIRYGIGVLEGPFVRKVEQSGWALAAQGGYEPTTRTIYKPQYDHLSVWDFYPDMTARKLPGEGYFKRKVLGRAALRKLADRPDFFGTQIKQVLHQYQGGNYKAKSWETELRTMGTAIHAETTSNSAQGRDKFEIIIWKGPVSGQMLREAGAEVPDDLMADDVDTELWMIDNWIVKAALNPWRKLGVDVAQVHVFNFDEDDTSPISQGLPYVVRDSQMSICAATRMTLDNASITCGPNLEVNTALMRTDQDLTAMQAYKIWYRDDSDMTAQFPAVRELKFDSHLNELQALVKMFLEFAEMETFIGPATGGDFQRMPSEPMRTAAGASMLRGDAALPFKDIVRNYDSFTQSVIWSLVQFNKQFNPDEAPEGDYSVIARGATSLIAKEVRGAQIDMLSQTLTPDERDHIDERRFVEAKFASRDMSGMLVSPDEAARRKQQKAELAAQQQAQADALAQANLKNIAGDTFKAVTQGQKNASNADAVGVKAAIDMINAGEFPNANQEQDRGAGGAPARGGQGA